MRWSRIGSRPRGDHARGRTARTSRRRRAVGSTGCATAGWRRSPGSIPAPSSATFATAARCAGSSRPRPRSRGARAGRRRALDGGADFAREVTPAEPIEIAGDGPHVVGLDTGIKHSIVRQLQERGCRITLPPATARRRRCSPEIRPDLSGEWSRRPRLARLRGRERSRGGRQEAGGRHLPRASAALPRGLETFKLPSATAARITGQGPRDGQDRHHLPESRLRGPGAGWRREDRWG